MLGHEAQPTGKRGRGLEFDNFDRRIMAILATDGRISLQELADRINLSRAAVHERLKKLQLRRVVQGYRAILDAEQLGYPVLAWVGLQTAQGVEAYKTLDELQAIPEIEAAYVVTGQFDILVKIRAHDNAHLQKILFENVDQVSGFKRSETMVVLSASTDKYGLSPDLVEKLNEDHFPDP